MSLPADGSAPRGSVSRPVRFTFLDLSYGCHSGRFELDARGRPLVVAGPNGAGKSSLAEALVRVLYGFNRQRKDERHVHEARRPWAAEAYRGRLGLDTSRGPLAIERDFETDEVVVRDGSGGPPVFRGEANPAASGDDIRRYRALVEDLLGLASLDDYERTACVHQGALPGTRLSDDLLRIAAGGHADVESAREAVRERYHALTVEPIAEGESRRRKGGEVERRREAIRELEARAAAARAAEGRREPLVRRREELRSRAAALEDEVRALEAGLEAIARTDRLDARLDASRGRLEQLEESVRELDEAIARVELLEADADVEAAGYPADFPERAAALEELWPRERELEAARERLRALAASAPAGPARRGAVLATGGGAAAVAAGLLSLVLGVVAAAALAGVAIGLAAALWGTWLRRRARADALEGEAALEAATRELEEVRGRIREKLRGVPEADRLSPEDLPGRRRAFARRVERARHRERVRDRLRAEMDDARRVLRRFEPARETAPDGGPAGGTSRRSGPGEDAPVPRDETLAERARDLLARLRGAESTERNERFAPLNLELRQASRGRVELRGVPSEAGAVREALERRRAERLRLQEEAAEVERRLAYEARPEESSVAVEGRLAEEREALAEAEAHARACRHAFALLRDAYEAFRRTDQERLLERVSAHVERVTGGTLGPVRTAPGQGLESARLEAGCRSLPLESPPLSFGQLHAVLLAVRLGAADFLAGLGAPLPLLVDDPFVHLDEGRAAEVWEALGRVARERQVVVFTQDRLLLGHLGVVPDLELAAPSGRPAATGAGGGRTAGRELPEPGEAEREPEEAAEREDREEAERAEPEEVVLDLFGPA